MGAVLSLFLKGLTGGATGFCGYDPLMNMLKSNLLRGAALETKTVAVVGASADRSKFSNKSIRAHAQQGWSVYPVNPKGGEIEGRAVHTSVTGVPVHLNRVTLYLAPALGIKILEEIAEISPDELYLNPGTASPELLAKAEKLGLNVVQGCSIIDVGMSPAMFPDE